MIQELNRFQYFKTYKKVKITFLKDETNNFIENLQMLVFLGEYKDPVYATKLNAFEFYKTTIYETERAWANVPFINGKINKKEIEKIKLKDSELNKLKKFLSQFNLRTINLVFGEVMHSLNKLDASKFSEKPKKKTREKVQVITF